MSLNLTFESLPMGGLEVAQSRHDLPLNTELDLQLVLAAFLDGDARFLQILQFP